MLFMASILNISPGTPGTTCSQSSLRFVSFVKYFQGYVPVFKNKHGEQAKTFAITKNKKREALFKKFLEFEKQTEQLSNNLCCNFFSYFGFWPRKRLARCLVLYYNPIILGTIKTGCAGYDG